MSVSVRPARRLDTPLIYGFIRQLAEYEKLLDAVSATEQDIALALWGAPRALARSVTVRIRAGPTPAPWKRSST